MANLEKLFRPRSVALIGASDRTGSFGCYAAKELLKTGNKLRSYFINQRKAEIFGVRTYPDVAALPECPDLVLIATPAATVNGLIREAAERGTRDFIVYSSGFAEDHRCHGAELEKEMAALAAQYDLHIVGPNCCGIFNNVDKISVWGSNGDYDLSRPTGAAVLGHSGGYTMGGMDRDWIGLSYGVSGGNGSIVSQEELADYCVDDPGTRLLCMYMEGVKKPDVVYRLLKKCVDRKIPCVTLKSGRSQKGAISAASHTGNLAGSYEMFRAVFDKYGVLSPDGVEEYYGLESVLYSLNGRLPRSNRFAIVCRSGGEATMSADLAERYGLNLPDLDQATKDAINEMMPDFGTAKNPLDMTAGLLGDQEKLARTFDLLASDPNIDAIIAAFDFNDEAVDTGYDMHAFMGDPVIACAKKHPDIPLFMMPQYEQRRDPTWRKRLNEAGIPILPPAEIGYKLMQTLVHYMEYDPARKRLEWAVPERYPEHAAALTEFDSKQELMAAGIPVPKQQVVKDKAGLAAVCGEFGFPLVLKIHSPDILHKTEAGGVRLNVGSLAEAEAAFDNILESCRAFAPQARLEGILVQQMAKPGLEIILGVKNDRQLGPMLLVGLGGVFVEVFRDTKLIPCPICEAEALDALKSLQSYCLLTGYRGSKPCDVQALAKLMVQVSEYAVANKNVLKEMDINPVYVYEEGQGVCVLDALIVKEKE